MNEASIQEKAGSKRDQWRERLGEQARSGMTVRDFCGKHELSEPNFYAWRRRLRLGSWKPRTRKKKRAPVRFALVERPTAAASERQQLETASLELVLSSGERLRIGTGVDPHTLRTVLAALRG